MGGCCSVEPERHPEPARRARATREDDAAEAAAEPDTTPKTREELARRRREFWNAPLGGRPEMWQALKSAIESDEATARAILQAAGLTPLDMRNGNMCFSYDERGNRYDIPLYIIQDPERLQAEDAPERPKRALTEEEKLEMERPVQLRVRLSTGKDLDVDAMQGSTVSEVKRLVAARSGVPPERQRVVLRGRLLRDAETVGGMRLEPGTVLQVLVFSSTS